MLPKLLDPLTLAGFFILDTYTLYRPVFSVTLSREIIRTDWLKVHDAAYNDLMDND